MEVVDFALLFSFFSLILNFFLELATPAMARLDNDLSLRYFKSYFCFFFSFVS